jgi:hypothetical protein
MSDISSKDKRLIAVMRWIARLVSIPWAYCALGLVWFVAGVGLEEGMPLALNITIVFIASLLTLGAAILAGVWGMESLGGKVLLGDGGLILVWVLVTPQLPGAAIILMIPPILSGALFLECHRRSKMGATESAPSAENR